MATALHSLTAQLDGADHFAITRGKFNAIDITLLSPGSEHFLAGILDWAESYQQAGAVNVTVPEGLLSSTINLLLFRQFKFHVYHF
jgi:hypothetical protein